MAMVPNVRIAVQPQFPSLVQGSGPITVTKMNGIWTVGFSAAQLGIQNPPLTSFPTDYVLVWDSLANQFVLVSLETIAVRTQRSITASPIVVASSDDIFNINIPIGQPTCLLPPAASRNGMPLTFKDVGNRFGLHSLTITAATGETIDGAVNLVLSIGRQAATIVPYDDGVTAAGWGQI